MKKIVVQFLLVAMVFMTNNCCCMFINRVGKGVYKRAYSTKKISLSLELARTNIFNAPQYHHGLLQNLADRNNHLIESLQECLTYLRQQNAVAVEHVCQGHPLDMKTLVALEKKLQKKLPDR